MKTGIFLSYKGLGANLLHLSYCHQIAKKFGKVELITLCPNLNRVLIDDPLIKSVNYLDKFHRNFFDIINLSVFIKKFNFENIFHHMICNWCSSLKCCYEIIWCAATATAGKGRNFKLQLRI